MTSEIAATATYPAVLQRGAGQAHVRRLEIVAMLMVVIAGLAGRFSFGWDAPLWFDETFTGVIATQPTFGAWLDWCLHELSGPAYYGLMWIDAHLFGVSNLALRLPSLAFSLATPLLILRFRPEYRLWAALLFVWVPGFEFASSARPYALLLFLATAQALAFLWVAERPTLRRALAWAGCSAVAILTNYYALPVTGLEALALAGLVGVAPWRRLWPATLVFLPVAAWMFAHLPMVLATTGSGAGWQTVLRPILLLSLPAMLLGTATATGLLVVGLILVMTVLRWQSEVADQPAAASRAGVALALCAFVAILLVFAAGFFSPSFTPRYLTPSIPAAAFGLACLLRWIGQRAALAVPATLLLLVAFAAADVAGDLRARQLSYRYNFVFAPATEWLSQRGVQNVVFTWDNPAGRVVDPRRLAEGAAFEGRREGLPLRVESVSPVNAATVSQTLLSRANSLPRPAILWTYDKDVVGTYALASPPQITQLDPRWQCRDFGAGSHVVMLACARD